MMNFLNTSRLTVILTTLFVCIFLLNNVSAQQSTLKMKYKPSPNLKWGMFGLNRVHVQDFSITDQYVDTCNCGESRALLNRANVTVGLSVYNNLSKRWAFSGDLGVGYGSVKRTIPVSSDTVTRWSSTARMDLYYHLSDGRLQLRPYLFSGVHWSQRSKNNLVSVPVGMGLRYMVFNDNGMITAQVGYGIGVTNNVKDNVIYSWGLYVNMGRKKRGPVTAAVATAAPAASDCATLPIDTDCDGVVDAMDKCVTVPGAVSNNGCPIQDSDNDGVSDPVDLCPDTPGTSEYCGCPPPEPRKDTVFVERVITAVAPAPLPLPEKSHEPQQEKFGKDTVQYVIYFDFDKYDLTEKSYRVLDQAIDYLKKNDEYNAILIGHTDLEGNVAYNIKLSQNRVTTAKNYLMSYGIQPERLGTSFEGKAKPVITTFEKSLAWQNRRVEIFLVKK